MSEANGWRGLPLALGIVVLDQFTKGIILDHFVPYESVRVLPVLNLTLMYNTGAAFSFLAAADGWQRWVFLVLALGIGAAIVAWLRKLQARSQWLLACGLALILGGALGNAVDRVKLGHVVDFIHVHWHAAYFPAFNVADSSITVGAALLLLDALLENRRKRQADASSAG